MQKSCMAARHGRPRVETEAALAGCIQLDFELRGFDVASGLRQQKRSPGFGSRPDLTKELSSIGEFVDYGKGRVKSTEPAKSVRAIESGDAKRASRRFRRPALAARRFSLSSILKV